jgi:hypothetical protein
MSDSGNREFWPTPTAADATGSRGTKGKKRPDEGGLAKEVKRRMWPTPQASDGTVGSIKRETLYQTKTGHWRIKSNQGVDGNAGLARTVEAETGLTSSPEDSPASPCRLQGKVWPNPMTDGSGRSLPKSFASYDPDTSSWRTSQACLLEGWATYSGTWPRSGTMRAGKAYQQQPLVRLTDVTESGSWGTPTGSGEKLASSPTPAMGERYRRRKGGNLLESVAAKMWPTPKGSADKMGRPRENDRGDLQAAVTMWPTPKGSPSGPDYARREREGSGGDDLATATADVTPGGGQLNPTWVEWLMGFPLGWTDLSALGTPSSPRSPTGSSSKSNDGS